MGLKGNLSEVKLADIFKMLSESSANGLLRVQAPEGARYVEIQNGVISIAGRSVEHVRLGNLLLSRGLVDEQKLEQALQAQRESGKLLGQVLVDLDIISLPHLQEALQFQVEEEVHELFMLQAGEFDFLANATLDAKLAPLGGMVRLKIDPNALLVEALRRADEWRAVEKRITSQSLLFKLTPSGQEALQSGEGISWEGAMLLKLVHAERTVESLVRKGCMGRLATNQMLVELWDAGLVEPLPFNEYEKVARGHLQVKRWEEAQRVATLALNNCDATQKKILQALVGDIEQKRSMGQSTATRLASSPKFRTEIIRHAPPNLVVARERSLWPLIVGILLLFLAGAAAASYFFFMSPSAGRQPSRAAWADLEKTKADAHQLYLEGRWKEALAKLKNFTTTDPEARRRKDEYYQKMHNDFEKVLMNTIYEFYKACDRPNSEELKEIMDRLEPMWEVEPLDSENKTAWQRAHERWDRYHSVKLTEQFQKELKAIQESKREDDLLEKDYAVFLAKNPPEELAAPVREKQRELYVRRKETAATLRLAQELSRLGDTSGAKMEFDRVIKSAPHSELAEQARVAAQKMAEANAPFRKQWEEVQALAKDPLRHGEACQALIKFLETKPPREFAEQAFTALYILSDTESDLADRVREAETLA